ENFAGTFPTGAIFSTFFFKNSLHSPHEAFSPDFFPDLVRSSNFFKIFSGDYQCVSSNPHFFSLSVENFWRPVGVCIRRTAGVSGRVFLRRPGSCFGKSPFSILFS